MTEDKTLMVDLLKESKQKPTIIKNHSKKGFLVDKKLYNHSIIINNFCVLKWDLNNNVIQESDFYFLEGQEKFPELLLIGVGKKINDPFFNIRSKMSKLSIPVEIMSTSSACRTWNVLLSEGRNLLACIKNEY
tara:strand:+ start:338 stop:736 length:399 start_codon:yes stop_codon:yes gene_type:complete